MKWSTATRKAVYESTRQNIELVATLKAPSLLIIGVEQFYKHYMSDCSKHKAILLVNKNHYEVSRYCIDTA